MADQSLVSFLTSWLTPTSLFLFLNLMIGTIFLTSRLTSPKNKPHNQTLVRSPSLLDRVKSINFFHYNFPHPESVPGYPVLDPPQLERAPSLLDRVKSMNFFHYNFPPPESVPGYPVLDPPQLERAPSLLERVQSFKLSSLYRSESDPDRNPGLGLEHQVQRSKSEPKEERRAVADMEDEKVPGIEEVWDRAKSKSVLAKMVSFGDEGVDAKADDFITRFKQQLKLQRLDSLLGNKQRNA